MEFRIRQVSGVHPDDLWAVTLNGEDITKPMSYQDAYTIVWKIKQAVKKAA